MTESEFEKAYKLKNKIDIAQREVEKLLNYVYNKKHYYKDEWYSFTTEEGDELKLQLSVITTAMENYLSNLKTEYKQYFEKKVEED